MTQPNIAGSISPLCIIFSRFPRPGKSKTRLITELGQQGAAELQKCMTERLLAHVDHLARQHASLQVELHMAQATTTEMTAWLGNDYPWLPQQGNDLGERLHHSFHRGFRQGHGPIILAGADCPLLDTTILQQALTELGNHEVVLGPAMDGGYYLIGLNRPQPHLFSAMNWGEAGVLAETKRRCQQADLKVALLPILSDIDLPADLARLPQDLAPPHFCRS